MPPRHYELLAKLLADAIATDDSGTVRSAVAAVAYKAGQAGASESTDLLDALRGRGYEPAQTADGGMELRICPFHQLAHQYTELVCGVNLNLIQGILKAVGDRPQRAVLAPRGGRCCVVVRAPRRSRKKR